MLGKQFEKSRFEKMYVSTRRSTSSILLGVLALATLGFIASSASAEGDAELARGAQLFELCTQCHMSDGAGNSEFLAPAIAGLPAWYVESQLKNFKNGIRGLHAKDVGGLRMYPMSLWLRSEADQKAVAAYAASLPVPTLEHELELPGDAAKGAVFYAVCAGCHQPDGKGSQMVSAPPLVGQSDWYLFTSIQKYKSGVRGSNPGDAQNGPVMTVMAGTLPDDAAIRDVIAHIQSLSK